MSDLEILALRHIKKLTEEVQHEIIKINVALVSKKEDLDSDRVLRLHGEVGDIKTWSEAIIENAEH